MQTPKSKYNHVNGPKKTTLRSSSDPLSHSPHHITRTQKDRNHKINERWSPQGHVNERASSKLSDLEACIAQLQEELKMSKEQATSVEIQKRQAQLEIEEGKRQISAIMAKLKETDEQLIEITSSEDDRLQELCKISQERDRAWELELKAVRKQHSLDVGALASANDEIRWLKTQLEMVRGSEAFQIKRAQFAEREVQRLKTLVERLRTDVGQCREPETQAQEMPKGTQSLLETVNLSTYVIQSVTHEGAKSLISSPLDMVQSLNCAAASEPRTEYEEEIILLKDEIKHLKSVVIELRSALDATEVKYQEQYLQSTLEIKSAYELVEASKSESQIREAELEAELRRVKHDMEELQAMQKSKNEKHVWAMELNKARLTLAETKASLSKKENLLQNTLEDTEKMKLELQKAEFEKTKDAAVMSEAKKVCELRIAHLTKEADQNSRKVARAMEQLEAAQAANIKLEMDLKRMKIQRDQWRKAAEEGANMLTTDSGKYIDRNESLSHSYHTMSSGHLGLPYLDDVEDDDDTAKKKNGGMLQKIGVLWKKNTFNSQM